MKWIVFAASFFITPLALAAIKYFGHEPVGVFPTRYLSLFLFGMIMAESFHYGKPLHRKVLNSFSAVLSLLILVLVVYLASYRIPHVFSLSSSKNVLSILVFSGLFLFYQASRRVEVANKVTNFIAYGSYVAFLIHVGVFVSLLRIIVPATSGEGFSGKVILYITGGYLPVGPWTFLIPAAEFLLVILLISYWVQKSYDYLLKLGATGTKRPRQYAAPGE
jgi:peptidoglycan/LPS O-acetylase OafA/YrhL